jgi:hypothetical protein
MTDKEEIRRRYRAIQRRVARGDRRSTPDNLRTLAMLGEQLERRDAL